MRVCLVRNLRKPERARTDRSPIMDDLASQFIAVNQADLRTRVDYAVARKMLDTQRASGDAAVALIRAAGRINADAPASPGSSGVPGLGECVDCRG